MNDPSANVLSPDELRTLTGVLDEIIPASADGRLPGAGALGLADAIAEAMRKTPDLRPAVVQGLAALAELAGGRGSPDFAALPGDVRVELLNELTAAQPAFLPGLIFHTYVGYYQHPRVLEGLGMEPRPPHPEGYDLEPGDLGLLDAVRRRPPMYRIPEGS